MVQFSETGGLKSVIHRVLVIAHSGRMLAHAVRQAGYTPIVIDLYADQDTCMLAEQAWQVENLSLALVQKVVKTLLLSYKIEWVIYGSGLENHPETLEYLSDCYHVKGNDFSIVRQLNTKETFFKQLDALDILHPEVQLDPPQDNANWLIKPKKHVGGLGISYCNRQAKDNEYYQKYCQGDAGSVLFCADGEQFELIGFHRQWTISQNNFSFAGIIKEPRLAEECQKTVRNWLNKLVRFYHLQGLGSVDFICEGQRCYFLEINPRPPASMLLYPELDLLNAHLTGHLTAIADKSIGALQIVYARQAYKIQAGIAWPEWSFDWPKYNTRIQVDEPVCSIMAQGTTAEQTLARLVSRQTYIENIILNR